VHGETNVTLAAANRPAGARVSDALRRVGAAQPGAMVSLAPTLFERVGACSDYDVTEQNELLLPRANDIKLSGERSESAAAPC